MLKTILIIILCLTGIGAIYYFSKSGQGLFGPTATVAETPSQQQTQDNIIVVPPVVTEQHTNINYDVLVESPKMPELPGEIYIAPSASKEELQKIADESKKVNDPNLNNNQVTPPPQSYDYPKAPATKTLTKEEAAPLAETIGSQNEAGRYFADNVMNLFYT